MSAGESIGITLGDPSGIGPEIVARTIAQLDAAVRRRLMLFCDAPILEHAFLSTTGESTPEELVLVDRAQLSVDGAVPGVPTEAGAKAQVGYLEAAVSAARSAAIAGLVTAPISKHQASRVGFEFTGHTDFLAHRLKAGRVAMMFAGPKLKVVLATVHTALADVASSLTVEVIQRAVMLAAEALRRDFAIESPRIGVLGLNPHAGEDGMFGIEEIDVITPAVARCAGDLGESCRVSGPLVPDAAFRDAVDGRYDLLVAMYHDQGLIPVKLVDFESSVNVTLGLPIVRTSPDHGVAYDIAGTGTARHGSFAAALALAIEMVDRRPTRQSS